MRYDIPYITAFPLYQDSGIAERIMKTGR